MTLSATILALALTLSLGAPSLDDPPPSDHTLIYYNARMALREGKATEAVKLWLLRNALEDQTGAVSPHDGDFGSVTWAALGELGVCQDGQPKDSEGAGLWPLALHNWVVRNMGRNPKTNQPRPFDAFAVGRQQRFVSIGDVLSAQELDTVKLFRGSCARAKGALVAAGELPNAKLSDRQVTARLLRHLLQQSRATLAHERVRGESVIDARLFDINLQLVELAARQARQQSRDQGSLGRQLGLSRESVEAMRREAVVSTLSLESEAAALLRGSADWSIDEWMQLSPDRRLFVFDSARAAEVDPPALDAIAMGILDRLIAQGDGEGVTLWVARVRVDDLKREAPEANPDIWGGARGQALLTLDAESGFRERAVVALHRGVQHLERGQMREALQSMAYALKYAPESRDSEAVASLSLRWLSYIAAQFELSDELLTTLKALVPRREYALLLEDLMWRAALRADRSSFDRGEASLEGRGALQRRLDLLQPLASGDVNTFSRRLQSGLNDSPSETLRFIEELLGRLELEDAAVRTAQVPTLERVRALLLRLSEDEARGDRQERKLEALLARSQAIIEGVEGLSPEDSVADQARAMAPTGEVFAGSVRLAPVDPLPWPFRISEVSAPSVFAPMQLVPVEWRGEDGAWVFGWSISG